MSSWTLYVTDRAGVRQAQVDTYEDCEVVARTNDVSSWRLALPSDTEAGQRFITDSFARLEVALDGQVWRSGPATTLERTVDQDGDWLEVAGVDDSIWLRRRLAHPQPGSAAPPYSSSAYDVRTGAASTVLAELARVNAGPSATPARQVPGLAVPVPAPLGPTVTVNARWQNLLELMQTTAGGAGLVFDVVDLTFTVHQPADAGVIFSAGLETLAGWKATAAAPGGNKVYVAGGGLLAARLIREQLDASSVASWGLAELFEDRRDSTDLAQLDQAGLDRLAAAVVPTTVVFAALDTEGQAFGRDWNLGDLVTVKAGELTVRDQIRELHVSLDLEGATVIPSVGEPSGDLALFRSLAGLDRRVRQLERV